jgi:hypothetical protein
MRFACPLELILFIAGTLEKKSSQTTAAIEFKPEDNVLEE